MKSTLAISFLVIFSCSINNHKVLGKFISSDYKVKNSDNDLYKVQSEPY